VDANVSSHIFEPWDTFYNQEFIDKSGKPVDDFLVKWCVARGTAWNEPYTTSPKTFTSIIIANPIWL